MSLDVNALLKYGDPQFLALLGEGIPGLADEWRKIVAHIAADADAGLVTSAPDAVVNASTTLLQAYENYGQAAASPGSDALQAATTLTATNHTSNGAGQMLAGIVGSGLDAGADALRDFAQPIVKDAATHLAGSLLSGASAVIAGVAGAAAATGVGAVIGIGAALAAGIFSKVFGDPPPPPYQIGSCGLYDKPDLVVRYTWMWGDGPPVPNRGVVDGGPTNPAWRRFPDPRSKTDSAWFAKQFPKKNPIAGVTGGQEFGPTQHSWWWRGNDNSIPRSDKRGDQWYGCFSFPGDGGKRPIDQACYDNGVTGADDGLEVSVYRQLEVELAAPVIAGIPASQRKQFRALQQAFFASWKQNRAYAFNGLKMQPDWKVAEHVFTVWNAAHAPQGARLVVAPSEASLVGPLDPTPKGACPSYLAFLLRHYFGHFSAFQLDGSARAVLNLAPVPDHGLPMPKLAPIKAAPPKTAPAAVKRGAVPAIIATAAGVAALGAATRRGK